MCRGSSYTVLSHLDTYMTAIALRTVKLPKMTWNPEMTVLNYEGVGLRLARVNEGLRRAIEEVWEWLDELVPGPRLPLNLPKDLSDNWENRQAGMGWMDMKKGQATPYVKENAVLRRLAKDKASHFVMMNSDGKMDLGRGPALEWLHRSGEVIIYEV